VIILDTNVVSEVMKPRPDLAVQSWLTKLDDAPLTTTTITIAEVEFGLQRLPNGARKMALYSRFENFISALTILALDETAARQAGRLRARREASGRVSSPSDMLIAGIAYAVEADLATRNVRDFEGLPIRIIDPWEPRPA
jgi:predicted nucleic acid-binding protein